MAKTKAEKAALIERLQEALKAAASTVFVHFNKVNVAEESAMRRELRESGVSYIVARKTLIRRALSELGHKHEDVPMEGEVAIAYGGEEDATLPARLVHQWGTKLTDRLAILGGLFEGKLMGQAEMQRIAAIPPIGTLRGMFVNVINSPMAGLAIALKAVADKRGE
ncbi:MAG: 50S ribosomal protein L10 [Patescibacteria group bacterium]|nr:50S ribosomal protein L10 [bacterium]MDZ4227535.1 50S ribosomal protein L10 [Patescibacteria group bacterium]